MMIKKKKIACIILASGSSKRFSLSDSKLFYKVYGLSIIEFTLKNISKHINKSSIYITIPKKITKNEKNILSNYTTNELIYGSKTRFKSLKKALISIKNCNYDLLMVHDAARPNTPYYMIENMLKAMNSGRYDCALPCSSVEDTLRKNLKTVNRSNYMSFQTPQIFKYKLFKNNIGKINNDPPDDYGVIEKNKNNRIKFVKSEKENLKITTSNDIKLFKKLASNKLAYGNGFDIHKLTKGDSLCLAGLKIKSNFKVIGHSDGDVVLHAIIDALLGASNNGDIGKHFPPLKKYKDISSNILLNKTINKINFESMFIDNLDCTIICQKIRLEKYKNLIKKNIASLLNTHINKINVKAKTSDNIGIIGKSKAIACWVTIKTIQL